MAKWEDGELLHILHHERQWRLGGYEPLVIKATLTDAIKIDKDLAKEYPVQFTSQEDQPMITELALQRLAALE